MDNENYSTPLQPTSTGSKQHCELWWLLFLKENL